MTCARVQKASRLVACTFVASIVSLVMLPSIAHAAPPEVVARISLVPGLKLISVMRSAAGERDSVVTIDSYDATRGVNYAWDATQRSPGGDVERAQFSRFVHSADLARATRLHTVYWSGDHTDYRGYTAWSLSTAVYDQLAATGEAAFSVIDKADENNGRVALPGGGTLRLKGTLRTTAPIAEHFPLIIDGRRVVVPARRLRGDFNGSEHQRRLDLWVLADREHPLLLKTVNGGDTLQLVRVEQSAISIPQRLLASCRYELPGAYFDFATAHLAPRADDVLAKVAEVLTQQPAWQFVIEGHTDNVGGDASNLELSRARAQAVRDRLVNQHGITSARLAIAGFGETRPRESNDTVEGRARNRRVELVRACPQESEK
jgi:outer membrane protein OmpA-like peptidoglycan-associated protein